MSKTVKSIIAQFPELSHRELIEIQLMIDLYLRNEALNAWEQHDGKLPEETQDELTRRITAYESGAVQGMPFREALSSIRERLRK